MTEFQGGYSGTILRVDLTLMKSKKEVLRKGLISKYLGGRGVNSKILYDEVHPSCDPLDPENKIIFGTGPLTGTLAPCCGRYIVTAKSPLTGIFGDSNSGGQWASELKYAGYDHLIIQGRASKPVYLWIDDDQVLIKDAHHLWRSDTWKTTKIIKEHLADTEIQIACIGPAGENLVKFACIISNYARAAGRCGMGTVMGSKNLKAIAVRGSKDVEVARPDEFIRIAAESTRKIVEDPGYAVRSTQGTMSLVRMMQESGCLPTRNFNSGVFEAMEDISAETFLRKYVTGSRGCFSCPIHCSHFYNVSKGPYIGTFGEGAEYESIISYTSKCGSSNLDAALNANMWSNRYGLDTIETGNVIAWAMECYMKGILDKKQTDGLKLTWGNSNAVINLIHRIAKRDGFGNLLAEGCLNAAKIIGKGSEQLVMHTKGLTYDGVDVRVDYAFGLSYAVASRGGDHLRALPSAQYILSPDKAEELFGSRDVKNKLSPAYKAPLVIRCENLNAVGDSLIMCRFVYSSLLALDFEDLTKLYSAATGIPRSSKEIERVGERIVNVERAFNVREGVQRNDDTVAKRMLEEPMPDGPGKGLVLDLEPMLNEYYNLRGWDPKGIPTQKKLKGT